MADRFGLGYRSALAGSILAHLERIEVLEVMADDLFDAPRATLRAFQSLRAECPIVLHGVSLGLAGAEGVDERRLASMARVAEALQPDFWSEHLAFVRAGGVEIGHLAAPPRQAQSIAASASNLARARRITGSLPCVENIATLIEPPCSTVDEPSWLNGIAHASGAPLLLDLHNLYANAVNAGIDPAASLAAIDASAVRAVHLAGGRLVRTKAGAARVLDDHLNDVPDVCFDLLTRLAERAPDGLTVILERDGAFPTLACLLAELDRARAAVAAGRARRPLREVA